MRRTTSQKRLYYGAKTTEISSNRTTCEGSIDVIRTTHDVPKGLGQSPGSCRGGDSQRFSISICISSMRSPVRRHLKGLRIAGRNVRRPELAVATPDHNVPTTDRSLPIARPHFETTG